MCNTEKNVWHKIALRSKRTNEKIICFTKHNVRLPLPESYYDTLILCQYGINAGHRFPNYKSEVYDTCVVFALRL